MPLFFYISNITGHFIATFMAREEWRASVRE
jgi:hypothetical protein